MRKPPPPQAHMCEYLVPISRTGWEGLGCVALLRGRVSQGGGLWNFKRPKPYPFSLTPGWGSGCKFSDTAPAPHLPVRWHASCHDVHGLSSPLSHNMPKILSSICWLGPGNRKVTRTNGKHMKANLTGKNIGVGLSVLPFVLKTPWPYWEGSDNSLDSVQRMRTEERGGQEGQRRVNCSISYCQKRGYRGHL